MNDLPCLVMHIFTDMVLPRSHRGCHNIRPWNITILSYTADLINQTFIDRVCLSEHEPWCKMNDAGLPEFNGKQLIDHFLMFEFGLMQGLCDAFFFFVQHPFVFLATVLFATVYVVLAIGFAILLKQLFITWCDDVYVALTPRPVHFVDNPALPDRIKITVFIVKALVVLGFLLHWSFCCIQIVYADLVP